MLDLATFFFRVLVRSLVADFTLHTPGIHMSNSLDPSYAISHAAHSAERAPGASPLPLWAVSPTLAIANHHGASVRTRSCGQAHHLGAAPVAPHKLKHHLQRQRPPWTPCPSCSTSDFAPSSRPGEGSESFRAPVPCRRQQDTWLV